MINGALYNCDAGRTSDDPGTMEAIRHIYVHIPFCARICPYCAFYKERADPGQTQRFCEALLQELAVQAQRLPLRVETIFFGGGTPTALTTRQLDFLLGGFRAQLPLTFLREWTLEANPGSVSPRKAAILRKHGVNRISLGVQSWDDDLLRLLGREHDAAQAETSFQILRAAEFTNLNVDLMFGLPGQRLEQWRETLAKTIALGPEHISAYCLTYEEDTEFFLRHARGEYCDDPEREAEFFEAAMELLSGAGYEQYEISNYARPRFASEHNRGYWAGHEYLGIGPSAFSTVGSQRWQNVCDYRGYADRLLAGGAAVATTELLSAEMKRAERIALLLRTPEGVPAEWLTPWPNECAEFGELGLLRRNNGRFALTTKGKLLADSVAAAFV
jgi:oxygen-independent coproporphyrinogen-3 oxidase